LVGFEWIGEAGGGFCEFLEGVGDFFFEEDAGVFDEGFQAGDQFEGVFADVEGFDVGFEEGEQVVDFGRE